MFRDDEVDNWSDEELEDEDADESNQSNLVIAVPETSVTQNDSVPNFDENEPQLVSTLLKLNRTNEKLAEEMKTLRKTNSKLLTQVKFLHHSVFTPLPASPQSAGAVKMFGGEDLMQIAGDTPSKFALDLALSGNMFTKDELVHRMFEPATSNGREALDIAKTNIIKGSEWFRFGQSPVVFTQARLAIIQWGKDEGTRRREARKYAASRAPTSGALALATQTSEESASVTSKEKQLGIESEAGEKELL